MFICQHILYCIVYRYSRNSRYSRSATGVSLLSNTTNCISAIIPQAFASTFTEPSQFLHTKFRGNKFFRKQIFVRIYFLAFDRIGQIRENLFSQNVPKFKDSQNYFKKTEMGNCNIPEMHLLLSRRNLC